jgi:hypothetical protein
MKDPVMTLRLPREVSVALRMASARETLRRSAPVSMSQLIREGISHVLYQERSQNGQALPLHY